jgi:hypothetical protein
MPTNTYVALDKVTVGTATPTITFSGISGAYTDLVIVGNWGQSLDAESCLFRVGNGSVDTGSNYSATEVYGTGSAAGSQRTSSATGARITFASGGGSAVTSNFQLHLMNYSNTTTNKTFLTRTNVPSSTYPATSAFTSLWRSTAAINTVQLYLTGGNFLVGSTFSLYGIAAEGVSPAAKATGGAIYSDSLYYYHAFAASGTFTPLQSLTCDYLVVAGGGAGGFLVAGGGGAGGLVYKASQSLTATGYTITVGAGGTYSGATAGTNGSDSSGFTFTATGGGRAGTWAGSGSFQNGASGGSGGGGGANTAGGSGGSSTQNAYSGDGFGTSGGSGYFNSGGATQGGGGGGGAGGAGVSGQTGSQPNGGAGKSYPDFANATGTGVGGAYAGGGGGNRYNVDGGTATAGGGAGSGGSTAAAGVAHTGGGGGGGNPGANGGSGIVIVRYLKA